jgi:hypothetical protein
MQRESEADPILSLFCFPKKQQQSHSRRHFQEPDRQRRALFSSILNRRHLVHHVPSRCRASQVPQVVGDHTDRGIGCSIFNTVGRAPRCIASRRSLTLILYGMRIFMCSPPRWFWPMCIPFVLVAQNNVAATCRSLRHSRLLFTAAISLRDRLVSITFH